MLRKILTVLILISLLPVFAWGLKFVGVNTNNFNLAGLESKCFSLKLERGWKHYPSGFNPNREFAANAYAEHAGLAVNTYFDPKSFVFNADRMSSGWKFDRPITNLGGIRIDTYVREISDKRTQIAFSFRGTDGWSNLPDNVSNASWFTQLFNPWDQYRAARTEVYRYISKLDSSRTYSFIAIGHSLGGGLARHISKAFPCTSAVTFNSSFVTNEFVLKKKYDSDEVRVFEDGDWLSSVENYFSSPTGKQISSEYQWFRLNGTPLNGPQHKMVNLAAGMARTAVCCKQSVRWGKGTGKSCEIGISDDRGWKVWCGAMTAQRVKGDGGLCRINAKPKATNCLKNK